MAAQTRKGDLKLRIQMVEVRMDHLVGRFEETDLLHLDLRERVAKLEIWSKKMQESGQFVNDPKLQENASLDKTAKPTQIFSDTTGEKDESLREITLFGGQTLEEADTHVIELDKKIQEVSVAVDGLEQLLEMELLLQSLRSQEGESWKEQGTTQGAGMSERGSVDEREEFEDENREQEELRQLEKPDESGELVQDLAASSENKEHFGQGAEELVEDSVELDTAKESGTALSERLKLGEGAEDTKRGDEDKENDYELEAFEVEGCNQEGQLAEEVDKQEEAVQNEADSEGQTERDYISEPAKWKACIGEAKLESSEEIEKSLSGEREIQEELVKSKAMEEDNKEKSYELQLAGIQECTQEASEQAKRDLCEVAGKEEEVVGSKIEVEENKEQDSGLEVSKVEKGFAGATLHSFKDSEGQPSEQATQKSMIQREIKETLELITVDIEEEINMRLSHKLRRNVDERIRKLVASSVTEIDQKVKALEGEVTEQNRVRCSLQDEIQRLQTELLKTVRRNSALKQELSDIYGILNIQTIKHREFEKCSHELIEIYRQATASMDEGMANRGVMYVDLDSKYKQFKAKYSDEKEQTGQTDVGPGNEKEGGQMTVDGTAEELASFVQNKKHLVDSVMRALGTSPMGEHLEVEKVGNIEALEECRRTMVESVQNNPDLGLKAMEEILREEKEKHDCVWKGVVSELKLSLRDVAEAGCPILTDLLLEYGVSCNEVSREGNSPLHYAARNGNVDVGMVLLRAGSYVNIQNFSKETPLHVALKHENTNFGLMLLNEDVHVNLSDANARTPLHLASLMGSTEIVNQLIEREADVNAVDCDGDTPFYNAAAEGHVLIGENLMGAGADITVVNNDGSTPLHVAAWQGNISFCFFLLNQGVPVDPMNSHKVTPLHLAAMEDHEDIVQVLITQGARVNCLEERTDSPLHYAAKFANIAMMKALLRAGANVLAINSQRRTPLHIAAAKGHAEICSLLINAKSDVNALDERDRTPLHMVAMYGGSISVAELLIKKGANMTAVDSNGLTPWDLGYAFENLEFSTWLAEQIFARDGRREKGARRKKGSRFKK